MHDTQLRNINRLELCADSEENIGKLEGITIGPLKISSEIDFYSIKIETECDQSIKKKFNSVEFIGDNEEIAEIESIVSPLNSTLTSSKNSAAEENSETDEILSILKHKSPIEIRKYGSNPELHVARKICLTGKVIQAESAMQHRCSLPIRPRCVPQRVSNPFHRNFDSLADKINNNKNNNKVFDNISHSEQ